MSSSRMLKRSLNGTTALVSIGLLATAVAFAPITPALAADVTITAVVAGPHVMAAAEALTVTNTGQITNAGSLGVDVTGGVAATSIDNSGTISGLSGGVYVTAISSLTGDITNSGSIFGGTANGIRLSSNSTVSGAINNSGMIHSSSNNAIYLQVTSEITGGIVNTGTIESGAGAAIHLISGSTIANGIQNTGASALMKGTDAGIAIRNFTSITGGLDNSGTISATSGRGLYLTNGTITGAVVNSGTIQGGTKGIALESTSTINGALTNSGTIKASGTSGTGLRLNGSSDITGLVNNTGTIAGGSASGNGVYIRNSSDISGGLDNSGTISGKDVGVSLDNTSDISGGLTNSGAISGVRAVHVDDTSDISGGITNSGTIKGQGTSGQGVYVTNSSNISGGLTNSGTISGNLDGIRVFFAEISGGITNTGTIRGGNMAISYGGLTGATVLTLQGDARVIGDITDTNKNTGFSDVVVDTAFTTEGNIEVSDLTVTAGNKLTISSGNAVTLDDMSASAGEFEFAVDSAASFGSLVVDGAGNDIDLTGATVTAKVAGGIADGDEIMIGDGVTQVTGLGGGAGQAAVAVTDNSFLWDFSLADGSQAEVIGSADNTDLYFVVAEANSIEGSADTTSGAAAGEALNALSGSADADVQALLEEMNAAPTQAALNDVLEAIQPDMSGGAMAGALSVSNAAMGTVNDRLASLRTGSGSTGMSAGDAPQGRRMWGQAFGASANQDRRDSVSGYDATTYGLAVGLDTENIVDNAVLGVALSYGNTDVDSDAANNASTDVNSYQFTLYGDYDVDDRTHLNGMAAYTRHENDTTRNPAAGVTAKGSFDADQYSLKVGAGRDYYKRNGFTVTPNVMGHWTNYNPDGYTETGAGGAGLTVDGDAVNILELGVGTDLTWQHQNTDGSILEPQIHVAYRYDVIGDEAETTSNFIGGGAAFKTTGADPAQSTFNVGGGLKYYDSSNIELTADYDFEYKADYTAHSAFMRAGLKF